MANYAVASRAFAPFSLRVPLVVAVYAAGAFVALPWLLWAIGGRFDALLALPRVTGEAWRAGGLTLAAAGAAWTAWSMAALSLRGEGLPIAHLPPQRLVARGPYALMRHPIYVGYTLGFAGAGLASGSLGRGVGATALLTAGWLIYALGFEEPRLLRRHGAGYRAYREAAPILPRIAGGVMRRSLLGAWIRVRPPVQWLANRTVLFRLGPSLWVTYGALVAAGAAVMTAGVAAALVSDGVPATAAQAYVLGLGVAMPAGGRIAWLLYHPRLLREDLRGTLRSVGFVSWGGYAGLLAAAAAFAGALGLPLLWLLDRTVLPGLALVALGRLGCLTYGCCYGRTAHHGIRWTNPHAKVVRELGDAGSRRRVPTPLLSSVHALALLAVLLPVTRSPVPAGTVTGLGLLLYAVGRFAIECLRQQPRYGSFGLTSGQIGSTIAASLGLIFLFAAGGDAGWTRPAWAFDAATLGATWPSIAAAAALVFVVCGLHWKRIGRW